MTDYSLDSAQTGLFAGVGAGMIIFWLILCAFIIVCMWKVFVKAGKPGWAALVPIYNAWVLFEIGGQEGWKVLLSLIPIVGSIIVFVFSIMAYLEIAKRFGKSTGFGVLMIFFAPIMFAILAFSDAQYNSAA